MPDEATIKQVLVWFAERAVTELTGGIASIRIQPRGSIDGRIGVENNRSLIGDLRAR